MTDAPDSSSSSSSSSLVVDRLNPLLETFCETVETIYHPYHGSSSSNSIQNWFIAKTQSTLRELTDQLQKKLDRLEWIESVIANCPFTVVYCHRSGRWFMCHQQQQPQIFGFYPVSSSTPIIEEYQNYLTLKQQSHDKNVILSVLHKIQKNSLKTCVVPPSYVIQHVLSIFYPMVFDDKWACKQCLAYLGDALLHKKSPNYLVIPPLLYATLTPLMNMWVKYFGTHYYSHVCCNVLKLPNLSVGRILHPTVMFRGEIPFGFPKTGHAGIHCLQEYITSEAQCFNIAFVAMHYSHLFHTASPAAAAAASPECATPSTSMPMDVVGGGAAAAAAAAAAGTIPFHHLSEVVYAFCQETFQITVLSPEELTATTATTAAATTALSTTTTTTTTSSSWLRVEDIHFLWDQHVRRCGLWGLQTVRSSFRKYLRIWLMEHLQRPLSWNQLGHGQLVPGVGTMLNMRMINAITTFLQSVCTLHAMDAQGYPLEYEWAEMNEMMNIWLREQGREAVHVPDRQWIEYFEHYCPTVQIREARVVERVKCTVWEKKWQVVDFIARFVSCGAGKLPSYLDYKHYFHSYLFVASKQYVEECIVRFKQLTINP